jgi:hypothetical protein
MIEECQRKLLVTFLLMGPEQSSRQNHVLVRVKLSRDVIKDIVSLWQVTAIEAFDKEIPVSTSK